jgi:hypothetical protein
MLEISLHNFLRVKYKSLILDVKFQIIGTIAGYWALYDLSIIIVYILVSEDPKDLMSICELILV